jgi:hypothetical protein
MERMTTEPKPQKPMPSAAEINAYLEQSAARTKMRLPLAKGAARVERPPAASAANTPTAQSTAVGPSARLPASPATRTLPLQGTKSQSTQRSAPAEPGAAPPASADAASDEAWHPFSTDDDR